MTAPAAIRGALHVHCAPIPDGYIPAADAAKILGINQNVFYQKMLKDMLPKSLIGDFYRVVDGRKVPVKNVWSEVEIRHAAQTGECLRDRRSTRPGVKPEMPEGWVRAEMAAEILEMPLSQFRRQVALGLLPAGKPAQVRGLGSKPVSIWNREELQEYVPPPPPADPGHLTSTAHAILSRLRHWANEDGFVNGDATDIIFGRPMREKDKKDVDLLIGAGLIRQSRDNWSRRCFKLLPKAFEEHGGSKGWGAF